MDYNDKVMGFSKHSLANSLNDKEFQLIFFPTEQCNFRCTYCYEDFELGKMPDWLINASKTLIKNKIKSLDKLTLSWFGGEPLLAKSIIIEIAEYAIQLGKKYNCKISGDLTTNGSLLSIKTLERLVALKQNFFQISIDGDKIFHDQTRLTRNGTGSFDKIWHRLIEASKTDLDFKIMLRVHITDFNQNSVLNFCEKYERELANDSRFKLYFKAIENLGGDNIEKISKLISKRSARQFSELLTDRYKKSVKRNENGHYICYASKANSLIIRANGELNKCTVALSDERNRLGKINSDGTLSINNHKYSSWLKGFTTLDSWQMGCPLGYMNNHSNVGDIQVKKVS